MAPNNTNKSNPVVPKFYKSANFPSSRAQSALKFSSIHSNGINRQERTMHNHPKSTTATSKPNGHFVVQMGTNKDQRTISLKQQPSPWYKSSIIKLIGKPITCLFPDSCDKQKCIFTGSFLVGIVCLSIVAAAVVIRTDSSSREQQSGNGVQATSAETTSVQLNQHIKRSAPQEAATTPIADAQVNTDTPVMKMLNVDEGRGWPPRLKVNEQAVPIKVLIHPQLIVSSSSAHQAKSTQPQVLSSNVDIKTSPLKKDTSDMVAAVEETKLHLNNPSEQFVIEMDIKVRKHN